MDVQDPRDRYDDLLEEHDVGEVDAETFAAMGDNEAFSMGWVAVGVTLDDDGRVLLVYDEQDGQWVVPGGTVRPGETLREGVIRELREETGVPVDPVRPHATVEHERRFEGRSRSFVVVHFETTPRTTAVGDDLGEDDEHIVDADWFHDLPTETFDREFAAAVLRRVRED
ncbi:NUDIX hydrolase [Haloarchaeobius sp. HRN-SO-5]|uniref:NUDIX hydrolase n=1 Tax=Haloarchaeobius sp. HRN-SO-5 TaxID=3446118 RepID=UPI003EB8E04B